MRIGWRLSTTLSLFAVTAAILHVAPPVKGAMSPVSLYALPTTPGMWSGVEGAPEDALPIDPNEKFSVRRTYRNGDRVAWVSVALFGDQDGEARRASINKIYPLRNVSIIEPVSLIVSLNGPVTSPVALRAVVIHQGSQQLLVAYWHQIGNQVYGNDYRFRFALMREVIFARRGDSLLVRIATPASPEFRRADDLTAMAELASSIHGALTQEIGK